MILSRKSDELKAEYLLSPFKSMSQKTLSDKTIKQYLDYLIDAFMPEKAVRYDVKGKKYIDTPAKYYFEDVGVVEIVFCI